MFLGIAASIPASLPPTQFTLKHIPAILSLNIFNHSHLDKLIGGAFQLSSWNIKNFAFLINFTSTPHIPNI